MSDIKIPKDVRPDLIKMENYICLRLNQLSLYEYFCKYCNITFYTEFSSQGYPYCVSCGAKKHNVFIGPYPKFERKE